MTDLNAKSPCDGLLPIAHGALTLTERLPERITSVAPFNGQTAAAGKALGLSLPEPGRSTQAGAMRILWTGRGQFFVIGAIPPNLPAATTDQTDAWAMVHLGGAAAIDVMARLCPLDCGAMEPGDVARSRIGHMSAVISMVPDGIEVMVFRAFAATLVHELGVVMNSVAAQHGIAHAR